MSLVAPLFSRRARDRRAALAALRRQLPEAVVQLVLPFPLEPVADGEHHQPKLLAASDAGVALHGLDGAQQSFVPWSQVPPITVEYAPSPNLMVIMIVGDQRFLGVHGSGTFALSNAQLRRAARRIERKRPE